MDGNMFISALTEQIELVKAAGNCRYSIVSSYGEYCKMEVKLIDFIKSHHIDLVSIFDCYGYCDNNSLNDWSARTAKDFTTCCEVGDYDDAILILNKNHTSWKYRNKLSKLNITL